MRADARRKSSVVPYFVSVLCDDGCRFGHVTNIYVSLVLFELNDVLCIPCWLCDRDALIIGIVICLHNMGIFDG